MRSHRAADAATATGDDLSPPCEKEAPNIDDTTISTTKDINVLSIDHLAECALICKLDRLVVQVGSGIQSRRMWGWGRPPSCCLVMSPPIMNPSAPVSALWSP